MPQHPADDPVEPGDVEPAFVSGGPAVQQGADDPADAPVDVPPVPGPPPGVPDPDWPDEGRPPVNLGVMDPG
jgi:hypothetical protein